MPPSDLLPLAAPSLTPTTTLFTIPFSKGKCGGWATPRSPLSLSLCPTRNVARSLPPAQTKEGESGAPAPKAFSSRRDESGAQKEGSTSDRRPRRNLCLRLTKPRTPGRTLNANIQRSTTRPTDGPTFTAFPLAPEASHDVCWHSTESPGLLPIATKKKERRARDRLEKKKEDKNVRIQKKATAAPICLSQTVHPLPPPFRGVPVTHASLPSPPAAAAPCSPPAAAAAAPSSCT